MRTIGVVTVARSDYGLLRPLLCRIQEDPELRLLLLVSGTHLAPGHGETVAEIERDGFPIAERVQLYAGSDEPEEVALAIGRGVAGFGAALARHRLDVLVILGDRFEMLAAALAALPFRIPLAHVHGGESSEGAFDDSIRHALTKLSHLHFASAEPHARRLIGLGEEPWRVVVSGAPGLDAIRESAPLDDDELARRLGTRLNGSTLLVTYHPATLDPEDVRTRARQLLDAVAASGLAVVFTYPNADPGGIAIRELIDEYVRDHDDACAVASLGSDGYFALARRVVAMVGNSSSGIIEAASFALPVVNVGIRQHGRLRTANVIDVADDTESILAGIERAVSPGFRATLAVLENPYDHGGAADRIVETLKRVELGPRLLQKRFHDDDG
jgi:UDP-hydrolysing UDP-N-acetyl-D-glucosamine 2-epimerase